MATPYVLVELGITASTQHEARSRFRGSPLLVTAERQTSGRGRLGRSWESAPRAVAASLAISPRWPERSFGVIPLVAGLAACDAIGDAVGLKWPNDLVAGDLKVGGILAEADGDTVVIGLGVNLWWPDPMEGAAALFSGDPGREAPGWMAEHWADRMIARLAGGPGGWGREEYLTLCSTIGHRISWEPDGAGTATGIAPDGGLIVDTPDGETVLRSGEVSDVRPAGA